MKHTTLLLTMLLVGCATDELPEGDPDGEAISAVIDDHNGGCPDGGGTGGGGEPYPVPAPRDCTAEPTLEQCLTCCDWNVEKVWGENCRRMPGRTKKQRKEKALCWERAEGLRGQCQAACPRPGPIVTITGAP